MATMNSVIEYVDGVKPNVYTDEDKYNWLSRFEGTIRREVHEEETVEPMAVPGDADKQLSVPHPYDDVYGLYLMAMIDFHNREIGSYNNNVLMYTERLEAYKKYYIRRYGNSGKYRNFRNVMG